MSFSVKELIAKVPRLVDHLREFGIFNAMKSLATPEGREIDSLAHVNKAFPALSSALLGYEARLNELLGTCETIHRPLYPPMTFFTDLFENYKRLTPSVNGRRATKILETLSTGALNPPQNQQRPISIGDVGSLESKGLVE